MKKKSLFLDKSPSKFKKKSLFVRFENIIELFNWLRLLEVLKYENTNILVFE